MRLQRTWLTVAAVACAVLLTGYGANAQTRRLRVRPRVLAAPSSAEYSDSAEEAAAAAAADDSRPQAQGAIPQYYARAQERIGESNGGGGGQRLVLVAAGDDDEYNQYGASVRARADREQYQRPAAKSTSAPATVTVAARSKAAQSNEARAPPVQTIRNYSKVNDDGSFTFGYEAADGSFKEETRGTDCVVRGKYGYIDPDGNKREFTYVSGNPCDPNNPDGSEEEEERPERDGDGESGENVPQNYPQRRPQPQAAGRPATIRPTAPTPVRPTTTVFQNDYSDRNRGPAAGSDEEPQEVQIGQRQGGGGLGRPAARPFGGVQSQPTLATVTQRPRVQLVATTPSSVAPAYHSPSPPPPSQTVVPVNITPKPVYRVSPQPTQPTLAPTTYRPVAPVEFGSTASTRGPSNIDFEAEFKRFQQDNKLPSPPPSSSSSSFPSTTSKPASPSPSPFGKGPSSTVGVANGNPIYQSQLIFDPASGQYDTALYQQLPQSDGDFQLNHRIQPYVAGPPQHQHPSAGQLVSLEQLQQQSPLYRTAGPAQQHIVSRPQQPQQVQIPQQLYQKQQNELQFINSQQLFAQQLELQQSQLRADRLEAAKKVTGPSPAPLHRFQPQPQQQYYFIQPQGPPQSGGQIDAFLRGHNIEY
ncbi:zyxin-like [Anopheles darlingi]|uniref:zyxin-like n=1 Tax=Anopheles darlingi TaxID=43151 RepID=UPI0021006248|nr:zyxin-like [Anopheles darlingi]XP_049534452.1 zyxin-like [Anopheles darlingi]